MDWLALAVGIAAFVWCARWHGRRLRLEREALGFPHVDFRGPNPPEVTALWRAERIRFWSIAVAIEAVALLILLTTYSLTPLQLATSLTLAGALSFVTCGALSMRRRGEQ